MRCTHGSFHYIIVRIHRCMGAMGNRYWSFQRFKWKAMLWRHGMRYCHVLVFGTNAKCNVRAMHITGFVLNSSKGICFGITISPFCFSLCLVLFRQLSCLLSFAFESRCGVRYDILCVCARVNVLKCVLVKANRIGLAGNAEMEEHRNAWSGRYIWSCLLMRKLMV